MKPEAKYNWRDLKPRSLAFWLSWIVIGAAYEIWAVVMERRSGDQPLTRVVRDRLARIPRWGKIIQMVVMGVLGWWFIHWAVNLPW